MSQETPVSRHFTRVAVSTLVTLIGVSACAVPGGMSPGAKAIDQIAQRMIDAAEVQTDVRDLNVCVHWIHSLLEADRSEGQHADSHEKDPIALQLQHEFIVALSRRLRVVEFELLAEQVDGIMHGKVTDLVENYGITHVVVGDYVRRGNDLNVAVRLVDAGSFTIVAAASGTIPLWSLQARTHGRH